MNPVTAHTASKISDFTALDPDRYRTVCVFGTAPRFAIDSFISQDEPWTTTHPRRRAA